MSDKLSEVRLVEGGTKLVVGDRPPRHLPQGSSDFYRSLAYNANTKEAQLYNLAVAAWVEEREAEALRESQEVASPTYFPDRIAELEKQVEHLLERVDFLERVGG